MIQRKWHQFHQRASLIGQGPTTPDITTIATLHWPGGTPFVLNASAAAFAHVAAEWSYIVGNRQRWASVQSAVQGQVAEAATMLKTYAIDDRVVHAIAEAGVVEVEVSGGPIARSFPWEFVIAAATRPQRRGRPLTVLRRVPTPRPPLPPLGAMRTVLFVQSAPGRLANLYSFESERALIHAALHEWQWRELFDPTATELEDAILAERPTLVHLAGFDAHQSRRLLPSDTTAATDGFMLRDDAEGETAADADQLAALVTAHQQHRPHLVSFSIWNSGGALAPAAVAAGAGAAMGFLDSFDDTLAEAFFTGFYGAWGAQEPGEPPTDLPAAFVAAWTSIRNSGPSLLGSGVTLWSGSPLLRADSDQTLRRVTRRGTGSGYRRTGTGPGTLPPGTGTGTGSGTGSGTGVTIGAPGVAPSVLDPDGMSAQDRADTLRVTVEPLTELNYSLLHNHRPLFSQFKITQLKPGIVTDLSVTVDLFCGGESWPYRSSVQMHTNPLDLRDQVHVTLTSSLVRSTREAINTSLLVEVKWKSHVLWSNTTRVRLLPADQWRDNDVDRIWLPSFVLPRDPAVVSLVDRAQQYVRVLRDDPDSGFDGYQSVDPDRDDPGEEVDLQVQAVWSALIHEWRLGYINPPPAYSSALDSQRLRTPSMVMRQHAGTCVDLALLLASILEHIDIYPVIFLLEGHAFPGYWRTSEAHDEFVQAAGAADDAPPTTAALARTPWIVSSWAEVTRHVNAGNLVPLETVALTRHTGFWEAVDQGRENLASRQEFHSLVDTIMARQKQVTPLPIVEEA